MLNNYCNQDYKVVNNKYKLQLNQIMPLMSPIHTCSNNFHWVFHPRLFGAKATFTSFYLVCCLTMKVL